MLAPSRLPDFQRAVRAVRALVDDPDDLPQVFSVIEALSGGTLERVEERLSRSEGGRRILGERPDVTSMLEDRAALARLPERSLGRAYLAFVESEGVTAAGIKDADARGQGEGAELPPALAYVHRRMRDTHDLWHAVTGYRGDVLGEAALLAFSFAQTKNPAIGLLVAVGLVKLRGIPGARALIVDGFRRGRRAAWLPEQVWEEMLAEPVAAVRARLGVGAPPAYEPVRSSELRAAA